MEESTENKKSRKWIKKIDTDIWTWCGLWNGRDVRKIVQNKNKTFQKMKQTEKKTKTMADITNK